MQTFLLTMLLVMIAEFGDKTRLVALILSVRYASPWVVFLGMTSGYGVVAGVAVVFGDLINRYLPFAVLKYPLGAAFIVFGLLMLLGKWEEEEQEASKKGNLLNKIEKLGPFLMSFLLIALTEMGDKTQLTTAAMATRYGAGWTVFLGSLSALALLNAFFVFLGKKISGRISLGRIKRISAVVFVVFGIATFLAR